MNTIAYYASLDEQNRPRTLYRATPAMQEQAWVPSQGGWMTTEFLLDVLMAHGDTYPIGEQLARQHFPPEAFAD